VVIIDPGHGGADLGVQTDNGILEKNLTLAVARQLVQKLEERGIRTRITRDTDAYLTPEQRSSVGNFYRTRAFISLHIGGSPSASTQGPIVYVSGYTGDAGGSVSAVNGNPDDSLMVPWDEGQKPWIEKSRLLAADIQNSLNTVFLSSNRMMEIPVSLLEPVKAPAVMIEIGFLSNALDREFLLTAGYQDEMARLIADGITEFLR